MKTHRALVPGLVLLLAALTALLAGCGHVAYDGDLASTGTLEVDEFVMRPDEPLIYVYPETAPIRPLTAMMLPFRVRQNMKNADHYGKEIGRIFWQTWVKEKVFPGFQFVEATPWAGRNAAVSLARQMGADLAIGGDITYLMAGGDMGTTQISLKLEIYDTVSADLIWSMEYSGEMKNELTDDYIFFHKKSRLPADPVLAITMTLASDMAIPVKQWQTTAPPCEGDLCPEAPPTQQDIY